MLLLGWGICPTPVLLKPKSMASGRVGGTRSRISGLIGSEIYRVIRNDDGTYTQIVSAKGEQTSTFTTPRLQAQRMVTAMVESMMKQLKPVARISMQSGANKSKSLNAFSSFNLRLVALDCKAHWYGGNTFVYPRHSRYDMNIRDLGGAYLISSGTLQWNAFDQKVYERFPQARFKSFPQGYDSFYGLQFNTPGDCVTVADFVRLHRLTRLDTVVFVGFRSILIWNEQTEEYDEHLSHEYILAQINPNIADQTILTDVVFNELFIFDTSLVVQPVRRKDNSFYAFGFPMKLMDGDEQLYYWTAFTISYYEGRKKISSSSYETLEGTSDPWILNQKPTEVFGSWMDDPHNTHYPSPFE